MLISDIISGILQPVSQILEKVIPDKAAAAAAQAELAKLALQGQLQTEITQLQAVTQAQSDIDKTEAGSSNLFVSGWRPGVGWVCCAALAYQYLISPLCAGIANIAGHPINPLPSLDGQLWELMMGLLGMGTLRTVEKIKGAAS